MKILVTGSTGFIGNYVINELLKYDLDIIATARNEDKAKKQNWFDKVKFLSCDLNSQINFFNYFDQPDAVIHLAWEGLPNYKELFHIERNLPNDIFFLSNLIKAGLKKLTVTGTCLEYGLVNGCLSEEIITNPQNPYGIAKDTLRKYLESLESYYKFDFKWVRLFYLYGKGQNEKSVLSQLAKAIANKENEFNMSGGEQLRDYLNVEKVAEIIIKITLQDKVKDKFNCCSGKPISIRKLVENYLDTNNLSIKLNLGYYPYNDYEPFAFWGDNRKLKGIMKQ
ncbi:NAD-dependent epimerase/dehydratase family protein [Patescibacteria group bacterium]|nr:NAD-dependent epimerase/dehydratase family protein [Patescibacteria group bacterium]